MTDWRELSARASFASHRLIGWIYWDPVAVEGCAELGLDVPGAYYITSRCAPLAPAGHQAVAAAYYSISPAFIEFSMALAEQRTSYAAIAAVRDRAVVAGLHDYVPEICDGLAALADPLWAAADALPVSGRVLFAAHRQQPRPDDPLLSAWLAVNCIREWRGDTHWAVVVANGLTHAEASILHNAWLGYETDWLANSRGTTPAALDAGWAALDAKGLADAEARTVHDAGVALRQHVEDETDRLTTLPWELLGEAASIAFAERFEPPCELLLRRVDETAGPNYQPASRLR